MKILLVLPLALLLGGCPDGQPSLPPDTKLPPFPGDIAACFKRAGVEIPQRALTAGEVERLWASDRITIKAKTLCGARAVAWYNDLRAKWR